MSDDLTVRILTEIRDEVRGTNQRLDQTNQRLDQTNQRLDQTRTELGGEIARVREDLGHRVLEAEVRLATAYTSLVASNRDVYDLLSQRFDLRDRVERCEHDIDELKKRFG